MAENEHKPSGVQRWRLTGALFGFAVAIVLCVIYIFREPGLRPFFLAALVIETVGAIVVVIRIRRAA